MLQQLIAASLFGALALVFLIFWLKNRRLHSAGVWVLSYSAAAIGFVIECFFLSSSENFEALTPLGDTLYLLAPLLLTVGLAIHYKQEMPDLALSLVFLTTFVSVIWLWFGEDNYLLRTEFLSYGCAGLVAIGAYIVFRSMKSILDRALFAVMVAFSGQFVLTTIVFVYFNDGSLEFADTQDSPYVTLLHLGVTFIALSLAALLFSILAVELRGGSVWRTQRESTA